MSERLEVCDMCGGAGCVQCEGPEKSKKPAELSAAYASIHSRSVRGTGDGEIQKSVEFAILVAWLAGHTSRDLEVKELVDCLKHLAKQRKRDEPDEEGELLEPDDLVFCEAYDAIIDDARKFLKHRTSTEGA